MLLKVSAEEPFSPPDEVLAASLEDPVFEAPEAELNPVVWPEDEFAGSEDAVFETPGVAFDTIVWPEFEFEGSEDAFDGTDTPPEELAAGSVLSVLERVLILEFSAGGLLALVTLSRRRAEYAGSLDGWVPFTEL